MATPECESFMSTGTECLLALQKRTAPPELYSSAEAEWKRVRSTLLKAWRAELLKSASQDVYRLLTPLDMSRWEEGGSVCSFSCGPKLDKHKDADSRDCLVRDDGAILSFSVTLGERAKNRGLELLAYRFDLWFPEGSSPRFIRFDLDRPDTGHSAEGLRAHVHPGMADGRLPSPILAPVEAIHFLLGHLRAG